MTKRGTQAQTLFAVLGHRKDGAVDGVWGPHSIQSLMEYQIRNGIPATGKLSPAVFALLEADALTVKDG